MPDCEKILKCPFFNDKMVNRPASSEMFKKSFCRGDKLQCARYQVGMKGVDVPLDLYPNQTERIPKILQNK